jgi:hypothetical protein
VAIIAVMTAASPAAAQQQRPQAPPPSQQAPSAAQLKPYTAIPVTLPKPFGDAGFEAFRNQLAAIVAKKDRAALARLVAADFFWMAVRGDKANKKKPGIDNLAAAIGLDAEGAPGWELLREAAEEASAEPLPNRKGVMCAPASPVFDGKALEQLGKRTGTTPDDWGYPEKPGVEVHATASATAPVIDRLGMYIVRVVSDPPAPGAKPPEFMRILTPAGKVGFVAFDAVSPLGDDQLCYRNDAGAWKIAGYAGGQ